jgi:2,5-furandicarboxylate decarboxylase 1
MDYKQSLEKLEAAGRLRRVHSEVDPAYELAGVAKKLEGGPAVLFEHVKGQKFPLAMGTLWDRENVAVLLDTSVDQLPFLYADAMASLQNAPVAPVVVEGTDKVPAQAVVMDKVDLSKLPIPVLAEKDGGPYFDNSVVIAKDPDTGVRNTSIHRMMVTGKDRLGLLLDIGRHLRDYYERAEAKGQPLEITINNGVNLAYYFAAATPSAACSLDCDELGVASYLLGEPARLSKSLTVGVEGIADAQVILEAEILPKTREPEGPFGEVSSYYASRDDRWVVHVKKITHAKDPIVSSLLPGKEVWNSTGLGVEASIFQSLDKQVKGLKAVYMPHGGSHYSVVVQIDPPLRGMAKNAILGAFAAFPPLQMVTAVNSDVDLKNPEEVERAIVTRCDPLHDVIIIPKSLGHELNPITDNGYAGKMGFDATYPVPKEPKFEKVGFKEVNLDDFDIS